LPELDEGGLTIRCVLPAGISLKEATRYPRIIRKEIAKYNEVRFVISQLGRNDDGTDPYGPNRIENTVQLRPYGSWTSGRNKHRLVMDIKHDLENALPGANFSISQPILDNVTEAVTGSAADLAVLIKGDDLNKLRELGNHVYKILKSVRGASETAMEQEGPQTQLVVELDREAAARYGINSKDVDSILELAIAGKPISQLYEGERKFDIALRYIQRRSVRPPRPFRT